MTYEDTIAALACETRLSAQDWRDFLACPDDMRADLVKAYREANWMPEPSAWDAALTILKGCAETAGLVLPIVNALQAVFQLAGK